MNFLHISATRFKGFFASVLVGSTLFLPIGVGAEGVSADESYKAIVKINSMANGPDGFLSTWQSGTGVIIDPKGIILTNEHVVTVRYSYDDSESEVGYQICLTKEIDQKPDCSYTAKLIAADEASDLALLQIVSIAGLSSATEFPYLETQSGLSGRISEDVSAIGYPSTGGDTVSVTRGIISGIQNKYEKKWLKTDAVISFGNSGGALTNASGQLIGITTEVHSDLAGSLGYAIDMSSVFNWIASKKSLGPTTSSLQQRVAVFTKKQHVMNDSDTFSFDGYGTAIVKPNGWEFAYPHEDRLYIYNPADQDSGYVSVAMSRHDYPIDTNYATFFVRSDLASGGALGLANFLKDEIVKLNGISVKHVKVTGIQQAYEQYIVPNGEVGIQLRYGYGVADKDASKVNGILNSITLQPRQAPVLLTQYNHPKPAFSLKTNSDWYIDRYDSKSMPIELMAKDFSSKIIFQIEKKTEATRFLTNEEILAISEKAIENAALVSRNANLNVEVLSKNAHAKLNDSVSDVIQVALKSSNLSSGQTLVYAYSFTIPTKDDYISATLQYIGNDVAKFEAKVASLKQVLSTLTVEGLSGSGPTFPSGAVDGYDLVKVREGASSISIDKRLTQPTGERFCEANTLIKGKSSAAVYYCGSDGKRYVFPNQQTYMTWYANFDGVKAITDEALAKISIGGAVTYRPGTRMIKITSDPKVYAVSSNGELRPIASEEVAIRLYGPSWNKMIDDVSDAYFITYRVGPPLN
jgi:S1-C subfamily serine protease